LENASHDVDWGLRLAILIAEVNECYTDVTVSPELQ
jgi:hypothetical protein